MNRASAEPLIVKQLELLSCENELDQESADTLLARVAWSRIVEPGDAVAGDLIAAVGASSALNLLIDGVKPAHIRTIASEAGCELPIRNIQAALARWTPRIDRTDTICDIDRALAAGLHTCAPEDSAWPGLLNDLGEHAPLLLWVRGESKYLSASSISVVGARAATGYGTHVTAEIVDGVCAAGITIVSGAAYGIDAVAHRTALAAGKPTIAVLAGGADRAYPLAHDSLLRRISEAGAVCAEMIPGAAPTRWRFLQRNRIIAALSTATLVTEAGVHSGTLNTAGHAAELGRYLGAVPGPVTSAASAGCHTLIREYGAALITNSKEACELTGYATAPGLFEIQENTVSGTEQITRQPSMHTRVLDALPLRGSRQIHEIAKLAGLSTHEVTSALAELELCEQVVRRRGNGAAETQWAIQR